MMDGLDNVGLVVGLAENQVPLIATIIHVDTINQETGSPVLAIF